MATQTYAYNPALPFIKPNYPGNLLKNGRFTNEGKDVDAGYWKVLKWQLSRNPQRAEKANDLFQLPWVENRTFTQSTDDLDGKKLIPMHYGTSDLADEPLSEPLRLLQTEARKGNIQGALITPVLGENFIIRK